MEIIDGVDLKISQKDHSSIFKPTFVIFSSSEDPKKTFRKGDIDSNKVNDVKYVVTNWGKEIAPKKNAQGHVMDGFDPDSDKKTAAGQTADCFKAGPYETLVANKAEFSKDTLNWVFPETYSYQLSATVQLPKKNGFPQLTFTFVPKKKGFYSIGYIGAPGIDPKEMTEIWQPMIWQEKRFPNLSYLTESFKCPLPTTLVSAKGVTWGVLADPVEIPFMPLPSKQNSRFGVAVRDAQGLARPMLFAPVFGGIESEMQPGSSFQFKAHLLSYASPLLSAYQSIARDYYGFKDYRQNSTVTLNQTFENMIEYSLGPYSQFVDELRGCNYATDVPGAVKNISGLHPLSLAIITDNEAIYRKRARPMLEYSLSRERFLFSTNPEIKGDGTSANLNGPGAPMSDFSSTYLFSDNRMKAHLALAQEIYSKPINLCLNLSEKLYGDQWQNAMHLYKTTKDPQYLKKAVQGADEYLKARVDQPAVDFSDPASRDMFFWTSFTPQWIELYLLYKMTGEKRFLDAAHKGALQYTQFTWFCPEIPEGQVLVNPGNKVPRYRTDADLKDMPAPEKMVDAWKVSEIGLTPESSPTSQGHRAIYLANYAPWMLRIAQDAQDSFLHDVARSAIIGRYESFPGYHINISRTDAHEKADFAKRSLPELNGVTSLHFNHPWVHCAVLIDYLISDLYYRSHTKIDFPSEYAEGYAYCRSNVYGAQPGFFYDEKGIDLYMPQGLLTSSNTQVNYVSGKGNGKLYLALTNQSKNEVTTTLQLNSSLLNLKPGKEYQFKIWKENKPAGEGIMKNGSLTTTIAAEGITALVISEIEIKTLFQNKVVEKTPPWKKDSETLAFGGGTHAILFNFGPDLQSVYTYTKANAQIMKEVTVHYAYDDQWFKVTKTSYPFEFTIEVPRETKRFKLRYEGITPEGQTVKSEEGSLTKD